MFPRLTMTTLSTAAGHSSYENKRYTTIPLSGYNASNLELTPNQELVFPIKFSQNGLSLLIHATHKIKAQVVKVDANNVRTNVFLATSNFVSLSKKMTASDAGCSFELVITNVNAERAKVSTVVT